MRLVGSSSYYWPFFFTSEIGGWPWGWFHQHFSPPKTKHDQFGTSTKSNEPMYYRKIRKFMEIFHIQQKSIKHVLFFSASFLPPTKGPPQRPRPTPPSAASDAISDASEPEPTVEPPVAPPQTMGASPPMAVPSVQGFAQWNLERCPEVLEAAGGLREQDVEDVDLVGLGGSKRVKHGFDA